jgi:hypothetical protein
MVHGNNEDPRGCRMPAASGFGRVLAALVVVAAGCAQMSSQPTNDSPGISASDPTLPAALRDEVRRLDLLDRLEFLDRRPFFPFCLAPLPTAVADIDPHRSLFVHDVATLAARDFSLRRTLNQLAAQVAPTVPGTTAMSIFRQFWDAQNPASVAVTTGPRCTDNANLLNGFHHKCRPDPQEGAQALGPDAAVDAQIDGYRPVALVNRLDLAHEGWRNCGEFRVIYGKDPGSSLDRRNLVIFEAVLPNPKPGCRSACMPVAQMWKSLSAINAPADRAAKLEAFFYSGLPGFRPVVHVDHYSAKGVTGSYGGSGSGQIRTNQFMNANRWMLKEYKTVLDCSPSPCKFEMVPIAVKVNPWGDLWNEDLANTPGDPLSTAAQAFQSNTVAAGSTLGDGTLTRFGYSVALPHNAPQSHSSPPITFDHPPVLLNDNYLTQFNAASGAAMVFRNDMAAAAAAHGLTVSQLVNRALTQSCAGCHKPSEFGLSTANSIGPSLAPSGAVVTSWPNALSFVHVESAPAGLAELSGAAFPSNQGFGLSPALLDVFLPDRRNFLVGQLNLAVCPCPARFKFFVPAREPGVMQQDQLLLEFGPEAQRAQREVAERLKRGGPVPLPESLAFDQRAAAALARVEQSLSASRERLGLPPHEIGLKPQPLFLTAAKRAGKDARLESALRQKEVQALLAQEPPRRTVRGSFSVH